MQTITSCRGSLNTYRPAHGVIDRLRAKSFRGDINIYLHFRALLHIDMTQAVEFLAHVRQGLTYCTNLNIAIDDLATQNDISNHDIYYVD